jgi:hypothetical protein
MAHLSKWGHRFTRLFAVVGSALWEKINLIGLLKSYGTASGRFKVIGSLNTAWLPGFSPTKTNLMEQHRHVNSSFIRQLKKKLAIAITQIGASSLINSRLAQHRA